tara:strand:- start:15 stop:749 length:735 start_codon:yes stop_codon:yes gene_type:complete
LNLSLLAKNRKREDRLFNSAVQQLHSAISQIAADLPLLVEFRQVLDEHNQSDDDQQDAELVRKRTKKIIKAKFKASGIGQALDIANEAAGYNLEVTNTRHWFSKNTLCCREQHRLPCGSRSLSVSNFKPGGLYGPRSVITGIYSEPRGQDTVEQDNAGRGGNRTLGACVQWGLPPTGAGEAQAGRLIVLWDKKHCSPVLHAVKGVYLILEASTDANEAAVLRLVEVNHYLKMCLNGKNVEWKIY